MGVGVGCLALVESGSGPVGFLKTGNCSLGGLETGHDYFHFLKTGNCSLGGAKTRSCSVDPAVVSNDFPRFRKVPVPQSVADEVEEGSNEIADFEDVLNRFLDHVETEGHYVDYPHSGRSDDCFDCVVIGNGRVD